MPLLKMREALALNVASARASLIFAWYCYEERERRILRRRASSLRLRSAWGVS